MNAPHCTKSIVYALASAFALNGSASATLLIYEPFDYAQTEAINNGAYLGDGNQSGALGLGTWTQRDNPGNIPPVNEADVSDGGLSFTDGGGNALPTTGNA